MIPPLLPRLPRPPADARPLRPRLFCERIDWPHWSRLIDRKRRAMLTPAVWPGWVYREGTRASFCLEGIDVAVADLDDALAAPRPLRSRRARRLRAHLAIQRSLDRCRRQGRPLSGDQVLRWYTAVSSGLSTAAFTGFERLTGVVRRINSPQRRLQPAVTEAARLYGELLADPMFPGFNGILARLLLHAHLAGCGLPPVVFDTETDAAASSATLTGRLLQRIDGSLDRLGA